MALRKKEVLLGEKDLVEFNIRFSRAQFNLAFFGKSAQEKIDLGQVESGAFREFSLGDAIVVLDGV